MSKWRPSPINKYVIGDIHGALDKLQLICDRILPLKKQDKIIFLGDYIDRHVNSHLVLDFLIDLKLKYQEQIVVLLGNHELMLLRAAQIRQVSENESNICFESWRKNGGFSTLMGYLSRHNRNDNVITFSRAELKNLIDQSHWEFMNNCLDYYQDDCFVFVHGGYDPNVPLEKHSSAYLCSDRKLFNFVKKNISLKNEDQIDWDPIIVTGHSGPDILIHEKFMMLDAGSPNQLLVVELNSLQAFMAKSNNTRLVSWDLSKTKNTGWTIL
jgi:serine/threonine protein phosphatase 1